MNTSRAAAAFIALGSLAALPACSSLGMHMPGSQTSSAAPMAHPELSADMVRQVQTSLQQQGDYRGNVDGIWGAATQTALQSYQSAHALTASGQLDEPTLKALKIVNTTAAGTAAPAPAGAMTPTTTPAPAAAPAQ